MKFLSIIFGLLGLFSIALVVTWHLINNVKSGQYGISFDWQSICWGAGVALLFAGLAYLFWSYS